MPGIVGQVVFDRPDGVDLPVLEMAERLGLGPAAHAYDAAVEGAGAMARACLDHHPGNRKVAQGVGLLVAVDGEILNRGEAGRMDPAGTVMQLYQEEGAAAFRDLLGFFSIALWDGRAARLHLVADRYGTRPLYYRYDPGKAAFASEVKGLLTSGGPVPERDVQGISEFVIFGFPLENRTLFEGVATVPGGTILTLDEEGCREEAYWRLRYDRAGHPSRSREEWFDRAGQVFGDLGEVLAPEAGPFAVPLSGGIDSRIIAAILSRMGREAATCTIGSAGSADLNIAGQVAQRLGFHHQSLELSPAGCPARIRQGVYLTDGMFPAFDTHIMHVGEVLPRGGCVAFDGTSSCDGMYSFTDVFLHRFRPGRYGVYKQLDWVFTHPLFDGRGALTMGELFTDAFREKARQSLVVSLDRLLQVVAPPTENPFDRTDHFEQTQRVRRYNLMGTVLLRNYNEVRHPFLHPLVIDLVQAIPPGLRCKEKPITGRLPAFLDPRLEGVPYERTGLDPAAGLLSILWSYGLRFGAKMARRVFPSRGRVARGVAIDYNRWLRTDPACRGLLEDLLLSERAQARGYFDPERVRSLVAGQLAGQGGHFALLSRLLSLELWHRFFLEGESPDQA